MSFSGLIFPLNRCGAIYKRQICGDSRYQRRRCAVSAAWVAQKSFFGQRPAVQPILASALLLLVSCVQAQGHMHHDNGLTLAQAIAIAIDNDPWLMGSRYRQQVTIDNGLAASSFPDPIVTFGVVNLPTDGWSIDQEPMTQLKAGITQMLPQGDSLAIQRKQSQQVAQVQPLLRQDRVAKIRMSVSLLWLDMQKAQHSIRLIERHRTLFEQLGEVATAKYASALGSVRQQDILRAQLELGRLDDRLMQLKLQRDNSKALLSQWLSGPLPNPYVEGVLDDNKLVLQDDSIAPLPLSITGLLARNDHSALAAYLQSHPAILAIEQKLKASQTAIQLAKQTYKPQWGINTSYAYREDDQAGRSRADFFSIGISLQVPLFTENKQDKVVSAAVSQSHVVKTDIKLALRAMLANLQAIYVSQQRLLQRQRLFTEQILPQITEQAEASLSGYTNDDGDFAEVVRSRIADLNGQIDALNIDMDLLKSRAQLNYYFTGVPSLTDTYDGETK